MIAPPSFLRDRLTVQAQEDGQVAVTVTLPAELVQDYCRFLESLSSFFHAARHHTGIALSQARADAQALDLEANKNLATYRERLAQAFDRYTAKGLSRQEAYRRICVDLRAEGHPWRTLDQVRATLVEAGRGGRPGRPRRGEA